MSNPNPLLPQGALPPKKFNVRIAVFTTVAVHLVLLSGLLIQGCKQSAKVETTDNATAPANDFGAMTSDPLAASNTFDTAMSASNVTADPTTLTTPVTTAGATAPTTTAAGTTTASATYTPASATTPTAASATTAGMTAPATVGNTGYVTTLAGDTTATAGVATGETQTHSVAKGEMLSSIAKKYHVSVKAIQDANPTVNPMRMQIGQKLTIPAPAAKTETASAAPTSAPAATTTESASSRVYVVKSGDALEKIAKNNGVSVKALKSANGLRTDRINVGQKLKLPVKTAAATVPTAVVPEVMAAAPAAATGTVTR